MRHKKILIVLLMILFSLPISGCTRPQEETEEVIPPQEVYEDLIFRAYYQSELCKHLNQQKTPSYEADGQPFSMLQKRTVLLVHKREDLTQIRLVYPSGVRWHKNNEYLRIDLFKSSDEEKITIRFPFGFMADYGKEHFVYYDTVVSVDGKIHHELDAAGFQKDSYVLLDKERNISVDESGNPVTFFGDSRPEEIYACLLKSEEIIRQFSEETQTLIQKELRPIINLSYEDAKERLKQEEDAFAVQFKENLKQFVSEQTQFEDFASRNYEEIRKIFPLERSELNYRYQSASNCSLLLLLALPDDDLDHALLLGYAFYDFPGTTIAMDFSRYAADENSLCAKSTENRMSIIDRNYQFYEVALGYEDRTLYVPYTSRVAELPESLNPKKLYDTLSKLNADLPDQTVYAIEEKVYRLHRRTHMKSEMMLDPEHRVDSRFDAAVILGFDKQPLMVLSGEYRIEDDVLIAQNEIMTMRASFQKEKIRNHENHKYHKESMYRFNEEESLILQFYGDQEDSYTHVEWTEVNPSDKEIYYCIDSTEPQTEAYYMSLRSWDPDYVVTKRRKEANQEVIQLEHRYAYQAEKPVTAGFGGSYTFLEAVDLPFSQLKGLNYHIAFDQFGRMEVYDNINTVSCALFHGRYVYQGDQIYRFYGDSADLRYYQEKVNPLYDLSNPVTLGYFKLNPDDTILLMDTNQKPLFGSEERSTLYLYWRIHG